MKTDAIKEAIALMRSFLYIMIAIIISLISWFYNSFEDMSGNDFIASIILLLFLLVLAIILFGYIIIFIKRLNYAN